MPRPMRPPIGRRAWKPAFPGAVLAAGHFLKRGLLVRSKCGAQSAAHARALRLAGLEARAPGEMPTGRDARGTLRCARGRRLLQRADGSEKPSLPVVPAAQARRIRHSRPRTTTRPVAAPSHPAFLGVLVSWWFTSCGGVGRGDTPPARCRRPTGAAGPNKSKSRAGMPVAHCAARGACRALPIGIASACGLGSPRSRGNAHGQGCPWHTALRAGPTCRCPSASHRLAGLEARVPGGRARGWAFPGARTFSPQRVRGAERGACACPSACGLGSPRSRGNAHGQGCPWHTALRAGQALAPARGPLGKPSLPGVPAALALPPRAGRLGQTMHQAPTAPQARAAVGPRVPARAPAAARARVPAQGAPTPPPVWAAGAGVRPRAAWRSPPGRPSRPPAG